jgi:hypothetical protein
MSRLIGTLIASVGLLLGATQTAVAHGKAYHSTLRHNHHLRWWQLYEIYRWEKRFDRRRHHSAYNRHHSYDWYRRYWRDYDHQRRHDRRDDRHNDLRRRRSYE